MEIDVKKNGEGHFIVYLKSGIEKGATIDLSEMMNMLGEDIATGELYKSLCWLGLQHSIYAIHSQYMECCEQEVLAGLLTIEQICHALRNSVKTT